MATIAPSPSPIPTSRRLIWLVGLAGIVLLAGNLAVRWIELGEVHEDIELALALLNGALIVAIVQSMLRLDANARDWQASEQRLAAAMSGCQMAVWRGGHRSCSGTDARIRAVRDHRSRRS